MEEEQLHIEGDISNIEIFNKNINKLETKIKNLVLGARFYRVSGLMLKIINGFPILVILGIESYFLSGANELSNLSLTLIIILFTLQIISGTANLIDMWSDPLQKSERCSNTSKRYAELLREFRLEKLKLIQQGTEDFTDKFFYYSARSQSILQDEPLLICIGNEFLYKVLGCGCYPHKEKNIFDEEEIQ